MEKRLFIFVEGRDDERFFSNIIVPFLKKQYEQINIIQHAQKSNQQLDRLLTSIKSLANDYLFVVDIDQEKSVEAKKQVVNKGLLQLNNDKIIVVIKEIESWYLAGIDNKKSQELNIGVLDHTDEIDKEDFYQLIPDKYPSKIAFMQEILENYSLEIAERKNSSLREFISKYK